MRERPQQQRHATSPRPQAQHRVTVTVCGGDLVDAMCLLEGCDAGELATEIVVTRLLQAQVEDPDVQELVRARRRRRRWLHLVESGEGGEEPGAVPTIGTDGRVRSAAVESAESVEEG